MKVEDYWVQINNEIQNPSGNFVYFLKNNEFSMKLNDEGTVIAYFTLPVEKVSTVCIFYFVLFLNQLYFF